MGNSYLGVVVTEGDQAKTQNSFFWDNLGQLAGKSGRTALLSDISRNCNALFWKESHRKPLIGLKAL
jgi:hypothetical protein